MDEYHLANRVPGDGWADLQFGGAHDMAGSRAGDEMLSGCLFTRHPPDTSGEVPLLFSLRSGKPV